MVNYIEKEINTAVLSMDELFSTGEYDMDNLSLDMKTSILENRRLPKPISDMSEFTPSVARLTVALFFDLQTMGKELTKQTLYGYCELDQESTIPLNPTAYKQGKAYTTLVVAYEMACAIFWPEMDKPARAIAKGVLKSSFHNPFRILSELLWEYHRDIASVDVGKSITRLGHKSVLDVAVKYKDGRVLVINTRISDTRADRVAKTLADLWLLGTPATGMCFGQEGEVSL